LYEGQHARDEAAHVLEPTPWSCIESGLVGEERRGKSERVSWVG
jgi:hypothetical protein